MNMALKKIELLRSKELSGKEKAMLRQISLRVHKNDLRFNYFDASHYLAVGLSAIRCIENALKNASPEKEPRTILDFPCGYGRVLRFLKAKFPKGDITACDIKPLALDVVKRTFNVATIASSSSLDEVPFSHKFDLIWCGSLITHLAEQDTVKLLKIFYKHLSPGGVCVFTTHGQLSVEKIESKKFCYGLSESAQQELLNGFRDKKYGYAEKPNMHRYGESIVSHNRMLAIAQSIGNWREIYYREHEWDNHQDVYAFMLPRS